MASDKLDIGQYTSTVTADNAKAQRLIEVLTNAWGWPIDPATNEPFADQSPQARVSWFHRQLWRNLTHEAWIHNQRKLEADARAQADAERGDIDWAT